MKKIHMMIAALLAFLPTMLFGATIEVTDAAALGTALGNAATGDTVLLKVNASVSDLTIPEGVTLDVYRDAKLTNTGTINNNGVLGVIGSFVNTGATLSNGENGKLVLKTQVYAIETRTRKHTSGTEFKYDVTRTKTGSITGATADKYQVSADDDDTWHDAVDESGNAVASPGQTIVCTYGSSSVFQSSTNMNRTRRYLYSVASFTSTPALFERKNYYNRIVILLSNVTGLSKQAGVNSSASPFSIDMAGNSMSATSAFTYCFSIGNNTPFKLLNGTVGKLDVKNGAKFFFFNADCTSINGNTKSGDITFWFADGKRTGSLINSGSNVCTEYLLSGDFTSTQVGNYTKIYGGNFKTMPASTKLMDGRTVLCGTGEYPYQVMSAAEAAANVRASSVLNDATTYYSSADAAIANAGAGSVITIHDTATTTRQLTADGQTLTLILEDGATYNPSLVTASSTSKCKVTYVQDGNTIVFTCLYDEAQCEAKIGTTLYPQLVTALQLASASLNGKTVVLLKDVVSCNAYRRSANDDATYTIDLHGHSFGFSTISYSTSSSYKIHYITIIDSSSDQSGRYTDSKNFSAKCVIQSVMGGTFTKFDPAEYVAEGYKSVANSDNTWTVVAKGAVTAMIGDDEYETLADAIAHVQAGDTVELLSDCDENVVAGNVAFTFAPGAFNWTGSIETASGYILKDNGDGTYGYMIEPDIILVGETPCKSLAAAIAAIPTDGTETTVTLLDNLNLGTLGAVPGISVAAGMNVVLDLAGYNITAAGSAGTCLLRNDGVLAITDSSESSIGSISLTGLGTLMVNTGNLSVEYATFSASKYVDGDGNDVPFASVVNEGTAVVNNENGTWTVAPYPKANIVDMGEVTLTTSNARVADNTFNGEITFPFTNDLSCSFQIVQNDKVNSVFRNWVGDFTLTFDRAIPAKSVVLAGQTGGYGVTWRALHTGRVTLPAGAAMRMLQSVDSYWGTIYFSSIYGNYKQVQTGIHNTLESNYGANMVVEFRLFEKLEGVETGNYITVASREYKFVNPAGDIQVQESESIEIVEVSADNTETTTVATPEAIAAQSEKIQEVVEQFKENKAVAKGADTGIYEQSNVKSIAVQLKSLRVEETSVEENVVQSVMAAEFDVKPVDSSGEVTTLDEGTAITFRLPVDASVENCYAAVYHEGAFIGNYPVLEEDGYKFIEIVAADFSVYKYVMKSGSIPYVAKIGTDGYFSLEEAFAAASIGDLIELVCDTTLTNEIAVAKQVTLDLGTNTVTAANAKSAIQVVAGGNLTVNADATTSGGITTGTGKYAIYADYTLSQGVKTITVNGGVFNGMLQFNQYPLNSDGSVAASGEAAVPTTVTINGGTFNARFGVYHTPTTISGGTFEAGLDTSANSVMVYSNSRCPVRVTGGKFKTEPVTVGSRVAVSAGYYAGAYFIVGDTSDCEVKRNGKFYRYATEAFSAIGGNTRIEILKADAVSSINVTIGEGQSLTVPESFSNVAATEGLTLETEPNTEDGMVTYTARAEGKVAKIGGTYYATLDDAFVNANADDVITLVDDCNLTTEIALDKSITLALNGYDMTLAATSGLDLTDGRLTVTGNGYVYVFTDNLVATPTTLVIKGGTYQFDPSAFCPALLDADWRKDRFYVFANRVKGDDFFGMDEAEGYWTVVPVPKAYVSPDPEPSQDAAGYALDTAYYFDSFAEEDKELADKVITGDGIDLDALSNPLEIARATELLSEMGPFLDWNADFVVSVDRDIDANWMALVGYYAQWGLWVGFPNEDSVAANEKIRLLAGYAGANPYDWPYANICTQVRTFQCGASMLDEALKGTTLTVQLRLFDPTDWADDGNPDDPSILICEYKYTFGGYAAKINNTLYDTLAEAFAAVQSNDVVMVLNDFDGTVDLSECSKPFTLNRNGFVLAIEGPTTAENWCFEKMTNGNWFHFYKAPSTPEAPVVTVEVVDEDGETMSLSTLTPDAEWLDGKVQEGETAEEALAKVEENGLPAWQNYVIGQDPTAAVRVDTEQAPVDNTPVQNTLADKVKVPDNSGFKVSYELDKIEVDGTVVEGTPKDTADDFAIDLESATANEAGAAYFKMTAVIETTDGSGAKTKVASENTIGVLKVESSAKSTVIAVPWESLAANEQDITVADLVRTATLTEGDELKVYDTATGKYRAWTLNGSKEWKPIPVVGGASSEDAGGSTIARGSGVWLTRTDTTKPIYLVGEVAEQSTTTTIAGANEEKPTWNLVAAPTVEAVDLNEKFPDANEGDVVLVPTDGAPKRYTYKNGSWGYDDYETTVNKKGVEVVKVVRKTDVTNVPIGTGFWYMNAGDAKNVEW